MTEPSTPTGPADATESPLVRAARSVAALLPRWGEWKPAAGAPAADLLAGLIVALVALPLALGFGISSGLGAAAGLTTAVIAGAVAAVFGGSRFQVSGPTGAMTVVLVPIVGQYGPTGVLAVGLIAGVVLVVLAFAGVGRAVRYMPAPVIEGFTAGIAVVIALQQVPSALGITGAAGEKVWQSAADAVHRFAQAPSVLTPATALAVAGVILVGGRYLPRVPFSLIAVAAATLMAQLFRLDIARIGAIPAGFAAPTLSFLHLGELTSLIAPALAVAALAALESLLSATAADSMAVGARHNPDRELFGQGLANIAAPLFGGVPATGAIARTAVNVRSGARTRLAALTHALILAAIVYLAAGLVADIPLAALAGVLLATTVRMVETASILAITRATRADTIVMVATFLVTVVFDLVTAVAVGVGFAAILALRAVAQSARIEQVPLETDDHLVEEHDLLREHIVAYRIDGPLFFAAAHRFLLELADVSEVKVVILRMSRVTAIDATGAIVLKDVITKLEHRHITVLISGAKPEHLRPLKALGVFTTTDSDHRHLFDTTPRAIAYARQLVLPEHQYTSTTNEDRS
ncbi:SulP family inorganic anion transporter [Rhodococcus opacus]|uniref:Transporter n=1 Tax=Rhodococcus opacus M213 TaxID=1129896 RepID=K8XDC7_RHOOP|nr:SulP family inorganic anion transporter [Rhodococcus opacus]EKT78866.1 transporter [Rhodococcus opacus M213]MDJ0419963.1 SulP family inorganic anion transporter [Rhodococcus opacus]MDV6245169.1 SulP family inorganic anion transporter [Rhodococcus opacus]MDV7088901.1 SulP family inorganic anion transporter [Rhodococcus opacus]WKN60128.1 SulP family inorganic anion transporter [Rhodococcus opacus]